MDLELADKVFIVTGGTDGLGAALGERLVSEGARVVTCGRDQGRVDRTNSRFAELEALGPKENQGDSDPDRTGSVALSADVTDPDDVKRLVDEAISRWGRLDGLVNNAGSAAAAKFLSITDQEWAADLELKVMAAVRLAGLALPHLCDSGGSIVNVLSIAAKAPGSGSLPSAASRATGMAITKALAQEYAPAGVRVNAVLIGLIESGQWRRRAEASQASLEETYAAMGKLVPMGRVGRADEFADLVSFLLSERASYITGTAINLDGGMSPVV